MEQNRIVIVGGGIAGIVMAMRLGRRLGRSGRAHVTLVDHAPTHVWKPMLHTFASGTADYRNESISFAEHSIRNCYHYLPGAFAGVDRDRRLLRLGPARLANGSTDVGGGTLPYDRLILAIGSQANDFGTVGVAEYCHVIDDINQAERFNDALRAEGLAAMRDRRDVAVAIVGGGATGVELVAELNQAKDIVSQYLPEGIRPRLRLTLIQNGPRLLANLPKGVSDAALTRLRALGIDVVLDAKVVSATRTGFNLDDGRVIEAQLLVWAAGIKSTAALGRIAGLDVSKSGQLTIRRTLQTTNDGAIFALGDCASLQGLDGVPVPATAQAARQQAVFLAASLVSHIRFGRPLRAFRYRDFGSIVALGGYTAYGTLGKHGLFPGDFFEGRIAALGHAALYRAHQLDLNGAVRGGVLWLADSLRRSARPGVRLD